jgi:cholesterol transport system auxiliary component
MRARTIFGLIFLGLTLALSGCALPLPDKPVRPQPYDLGPAWPAAADAQPAGAALALAPVAAPAAIDGTQMLYRLAYEGGGQQPRPYALARWTMAPPQLLTQRLREALSARRPVVEAGTGLAALELRAELDEFAHVFSSPGASEGVVRLRVTATAPAAHLHRARQCRQRRRARRRRRPARGHRRGGAPGAGLGRQPAGAALTTRRARAGRTPQKS